MFLPFGLLIDKRALAGLLGREVSLGARWNQAWWDLEAEVPGRHPGRWRAQSRHVGRLPDPYCQHHIASGTFTALFLAHVLQFCITHRALAKTAGCTIRRSTPARSMRNKEAEPG
ncbi:MAG: M2 family metallopeptidase [Holophagales bacterium]|nr:M2 family metallopeptidase [Holophagales bacterium]